MLIFGHRAKFLKRVDSFTETCPNCGKTGNVEFSFYQDYFHIFWIPVIPIGKITYAVCNSCGQNWEPKNMPAVWSEAIRRLKEEIPTPWYSFIGLGIIAVVAVVGVVQTKLERKATEQFLQSPQVHDTYIMKEKAGYYHLRLTDTKDGVFFFTSGAYTYMYQSDAEEANTNETRFFSTSTYALTQEDLEYLYQDKQIARILRK